MGRKNVKKLVSEGFPETSNKTLGNLSLSLKLGSNLKKKNLPLERTRYTRNEKSKFVQRKIVLGRKTQKRDFWGFQVRTRNFRNFTVSHQGQSDSQNYCPNGGTRCWNKIEAILQRRKLRFRPKNGKGRYFLLFSDMHPNFPEYDCMTPMMLKRTKQLLNLNEKVQQK